MLHDGLATWAGKAWDHIERAKAKLAKDPSRRGIVVGASGGQFQQADVLTRETYNGGRGLVG